MKFATTICGLATLATTTSALSARVDSPVPGYGVVDLTWKVETTPGGPTVELTGTVQQVHEQLLQINPQFEQDFNLTKRSASLSTRAPTRDSRVSRLDKRQLLCNIFPTAAKDIIQDGIDYLRGVPGTATNGPGPGNCGRVSCSWDSAIWWCNDNRSPKTLTWNNIADSAQYTMWNCPEQGNGVLGFFSGQNFNGGNWNTIVRGNADC